MTVRCDPPAPGERPGWRKVRLEMNLSAWWQLEVLATDWERVEGLTTLDVLAWDLERTVPTQVLLLDWTDDPACAGIRLPGQRRRDSWVSHEWDNLLPVLVRAEVAASGGPWKILDAERETLSPAP